MPHSIVRHFSFPAHVQPWRSTHLPIHKKYTATAELKNIDKLDIDFLAGTSMVLHWHWFWDWHCHWYRCHCIIGIDIGIILLLVLLPIGTINNYGIGIAELNSKTQISISRLALAWYCNVMSVVLQYQCHGLALVLVPLCQNCDWCLILPLELSPLITICAARV